MDPRRILLAISGGIAAYKAPELVRALRRAGHDIRCAMTPEAEHFVSALSLQAVSGKAVRRDLFDAMAERLRLYLSGLTIHPPVHRRTGRVITGREAAGQLDREELQKLRNLGYVE